MLDRRMKFMGMDAHQIDDFSFALLAFESKERKEKHHGPRNPEGDDFLFIPYDINMAAGVGDHLAENDRQVIASAPGATGDL